MYSKNEELIAFIVATEYGWGPFGVCGFERVVFPYDNITVFPLFVGEHHVFCAPSCSRCNVVASTPVPVPERKRHAAR